MSFTPYVLGTGISGWTFLQRTREQQQEVFEKSPVMNREVQDFTQRITSIETADQLLDDYNLLKVTLGAFGLDEDIGNRAYIKKVLESDVNDPKSFVNRLNDTRYQALATTFGFGSGEGPQLPSARAGAEFAGINSADDLLSNGSLLRKALANAGLEGMENNQFFLQKVLESNLDDPDSFANKLSNSKFADFAAQFNFGTPQAHENSIQSLLAEYGKHSGGLASAEDLLADEQLLNAVVETFDLERTHPDFLLRVLNSDTTDPDSFVNQLEDTRYRTVSEAFGFGWPDINTFTSPDQLLHNPDLLAHSLDLFYVSDRGEDYLRQVLESDLDDPNSFVNQPENVAYRDFADAFQNGWPELVSKMDIFAAEIGGKAAELTQARDIVFDLDLFEATLDLFGQSHREDDFDTVIRALDSDLSDEISFINLHYDKGLRAMTEAFSFNKGEAGLTFPEGFAAELAELYQDRQFEIQIGESDPNMRLALAFEREMQTVVDEGGSEDAHWFNIMGSPPLRSIFETALALPSGFAQLDIERQLVEMKERSASAFGTTHPADYLETDLMDQFRRRFLMLSELNLF